MVKSIAKLRELRISNCMKMEAIIMKEEGWEMKASETLAFLMLTDLYLQQLESLTCFSHAKCSLETWSQDCLKSSIVLFNREVAFPNLETLKVFAMSNIDMIWDNQVYFRHLKTLDVSSCDGLSHIFTPTIVGNLVELKKLTITNCKILTQVMVDEGGEEGPVVVFKQLKYLKLHTLVGLRCFGSGGYTLLFPILEDVMLVGCPNIEFFSERPIEAPKLDEETKREMLLWKENPNVISQHLLGAVVAEEKKMRLSEFPMLIGKWHSQLNFIKSSWQLESLTVDKCPFINAIPSRLMLVLDNMKILQVHDCELLEEIFDLEGLEGVQRTQLLPSFMTLDLINLPKLRRLWNKDLQGMLRFHSLQSLIIYKCNNLRYAFTRLMAQCLASLQRMEISECSQMDRVIGEEEGQSSMVEKITFSNLGWMKLKCLPNLISFLSGNNHMLECPRLVNLSIAQCPKMRCLTWQSSMEIDDGTLSLFTPQVVFPSLEELHITDIGYIKMIWDNHVALSFPGHFHHLKTLDVSHCMELSNIFTPTMAGNLVELTNLTISNCKMLTEIISGEGCKERPVVAFKQLKSLKLEELIGLTCFSSGRFTLLFPLLEEIKVTKCLNMKFFSEAPLRAPKLNRVPPSTGMWLWNGKIRYGMQNMSIDMATVDEVEFMHLSGFSELMEKWHSKLIPIKSSWQLKSLVVDNCLPFLNAIPSRLMPVLDKINTLQVQDCESLEEIFDLEGLKAMKGTRVLPRLWCLNLVNLPKLRRLWNKDIQGMLCFSSLSYLTLCNCSNLRHAFTPSMARRLPTLQWIAIKNCDQMEGVMAKEEGEMAEDGGEISEVEKITFPILRCMELEQLPNLTSFFSDTNRTLECPRLQELTIAGCPKITTFTWQSLMKIGQGISSPFTAQVLFPQVKSMVLSHRENSSKTRVDANQHLLKVEAFEKLQVKFCVIEETSAHCYMICHKSRPAQLDILEGIASDSL
ncbi:hypothetical protein BT93_E1197 [Corymbia citriodora subsp. variegata]|nr:hypothetical protein BT93_E1197 [Corymbia citriodora subsp. variegata]